MLANTTYQIILILALPLVLGLVIGAATTHIRASRKKSKMAQHIASLEANLISVEERAARQHREIESFKDELRQKNVTVAQADSQDANVEASEQPLVGDDGQAVAKPAEDSVQAIQEMLEQDKEIPALSESELPGSINDIDFKKLLETR